MCGPKEQESIQMLKTIDGLYHRASVFNVKYLT